MEGFFEKNFALVSRMNSACIWLDRDFKHVPLDFGDRVSFEPSAYPLEWIGNDMLSKYCANDVVCFCFVASEDHEVRIKLNR